MKTVKEFLAEKKYNGLKVGDKVIFNDASGPKVIITSNKSSSIDKKHGIIKKLFVDDLAKVLFDGLKTNQTVAIDRLTKVK